MLLTTHSRWMAVNMAVLIVGKLGFIRNARAAETESVVGWLSVLFCSALLCSALLSVRKDLESSKAAWHLVVSE